MAGAAAIQTCSLDAIDGVALRGGLPKTVESARPWVAGGWMVGRDLKAPGHFTLVLRGNRSWGFATTTGVDRPDVVAALHAPAATQAGFNRLVDIRTVPPGSYAVLGLIERGADSQLCDMHRQLTIGGLGAP